MNKIIKQRSRDMKWVRRWRNTWWYEASCCNIGIHFMPGPWCSSRSV